MNAPKRRVSLLALLVLIGFISGAGGLAYASTRTRSTPPLTHGPVPTNATLPDGSIDRTLLPDLISVSDDSGSVVGYAYADDIFQTGVLNLPILPGLPLPLLPYLMRGIFNVWDSTGLILLGHMYPNGAGFLTLVQEILRGVSPDLPPPPRVTPTTVVGP